MYVCIHVKLFYNYFEVSFWLFFKFEKLGDYREEVW